MVLNGSCSIVFVLSNGYLVFFKGFCGCWWFSVSFDGLLVGFDGFW